MEINKHIVNIEDNEIYLLNLISLLIDIKNLFNDAKGNYNLLLLLIQEYNYDHKRILKGMNYLSINFYVHSIDFNMKQLYKNIPEINEELVTKYEKLMSKNNCYNFNYLRKGKLTRLHNTGECFGDITPEMNFNFSNDNKRNYNATAIEESHFAYIPFDKFSELLKIEKEEIKNTESKFLKNNFFFGDINQYIFIKKYLNHFTYEELLYNNYLFIEGEKSNYVYFLKFGKYEIFCQKSIKKICSMINEISNKNYEKSKKKEYIQITNDILKKIKFCSFNKKAFLTDNPLKLFVLTKNFVLGLESLYNDLPYLYNVRVLSEKCGFYKIKYDILLQMMKEVRQGKNILLNETNHYLELILERLINISQKKVKYINQENKPELLKMEKISFNLNNNNNKVAIKHRIITHKIKDYFGIKSKYCFSNRNCENLFKRNNRVNHYFLTELNDTNINNNDNRIYKINASRFDNKIMKKNNNNSKYRIYLEKLKLEAINRNRKEIKSRHLSLNKEFNSTNNSFLKTYHTYFNNNNNYNKTAMKNPVEIKNEENLTKKIKDTLDKELLFSSSYKIDKNNKRVKTDSIIDVNINGNNVKNDSKQLYNQILPFHNSSKNANYSLKSDNKSERNVAKNKKRKNNLIDLKMEETSFTKYTVTNNSKWIENKINDNINNNNYRNESNKKYFEDENNKTNDFFYGNRTQSVFDLKNVSKCYQRFNGISNTEPNIETYSFKGKKYKIYNQDFNKIIYRTFKEKVEDNLFMNGQTLTPRTNY